MATSGDGIKRICSRRLTKHCKEYTLGWIKCPACGHLYTKHDEVKK